MEAIGIIIEKGARIMLWATLAFISVVLEQTFPHHQLRYLKICIQDRIYALKIQDCLLTRELLVITIVLNILTAYYLSLLAISRESSVINVINELLHVH